MEKNKNKHIIEIIGKRIDSTHIQKCIDIVERIKNDNIENPEISFEANDEITSIDFSIIGHLILFKNTFLKQLKKDIKISFYLPQNKIHQKDFEDDIDPLEKSIAWKLRQHMIHAFYSMNMQTVFDVIDGNGEISNVEQKKDMWFVLSKKFLPVIYLNNDNFISLFENPLSFYEIRNIKYFLLTSNDSENSLYQACRKLLFNKKQKINYIQILAQLAYYRSLQASKVLRFYLYEELTNDVKTKLNIPINKDNIQVGKIQDSKTNKEYRDAVILIFDEIKSKPPFFYLVFFTLISSELVNNFKKKEVFVQIKKLQNLWEFTKELVYGLKELAKNIIEHSSEKEGIISGFINEENKFEINIFDHGRNNILQTFIKDTEGSLNKTSANSILNKLFKDDLSLLKKGDFNFETLVNINSKKILNQQTKRATAHLGLLIFSRIIEDNGGFLLISSYDTNLKKTDSFSTQKGIKPNLYTLGTNFKTVLPIIKDKEYKPYKKINSPVAKNQTDLSSIQRLLNFQFINLNENNKSLVIENTKNVLINISLFDCNIDDHFEDCLWNTFFNQFANVELIKINKNSNVVICIGLGANESINASQLFRFLGKVDLYFPSNNIIIYDITTELYFELIKINRAMFDHYRKVLPYWNQDIFTLFYSFYYNDNKTEKFYFTDILWGKILEDFLYVNSLLKQTNHNALTHHPDFDIMLIGEYKAEIPKESPIFFEQKTLIPFDLVIKTNNEISIFEENSIVLLNNEIKTHITNDEKNDEKRNEIRHIKNQIANLPGFHILKSHYRLGSKIHISDFFYAKRFFQNSFFSSRYAYIVANYIIKSFPEEKIKNLTIIGYGLYSELLVSLIASFLNKYFNDKAVINHNLINDVENISLIKNYVELNENILILTPIASTFSTSIKIEEFLLKEFERLKLNHKHSYQSPKNREILSPHLNLLLVADTALGIRLEPNELEQKHGWISIDNIKKTVRIKSFFDNDQREQKYFLLLPSVWHSIYDCKICFPSDFPDCANLHTNCSKCVFNEQEQFCLLSEKCLHVTDKASVTPLLLFDFPRGRVLAHDEISRNLKITPEALEYGHSTRNNDCFQYHIYDERFYQDNSDSIDKWLKNDISQRLKMDGLKETDNVLLFAPEHYSNTIFINLVNEKLFSNSATILHYDIWNSSVSNFKSFYKEFINTFSKIFFVDDSMITGGAMFRASDFIINSYNQKGDKKFKNLAFDGCFILINRITKTTQDKIFELLLGNKKDNFFSYANLHLPSAKAYDTKCQLCADFKKIKVLFEESFLDRFKNHYYKRYLKLAPQKLSSEKESLMRFDQSPSYNSRQNLLKIETIHRLFDYFSNLSNIEAFNNINDFNEWQSHFIKFSNSPYKTGLIEDKKNSLFPLSADTCVLLKVLALHPFNLHKPIKERVFYWTNWVLNEYVEKHKDYFDNNKNLSISELRDLKFLIRRAGLINSNYLISNRFLLFIIKFMKIIANESLAEGIVNELRTIEIDLYTLQSKRIEEIKGIQKKQLKNIKRGLTSTQVSGDDVQINIELAEINNSIQDFTFKKKNLEDFLEIVEYFPTYFAAQIKELLFHNEAKSIVIEQRILPLYNSLKENSEVRKLFRMILEENGVLINSFWKSVKDELIDYAKPILKNNNEFEIWNDGKFVDIIKKKQNQINELEIFFEIVKSSNKYDGSISENLLFRKFLQLKTLLTIESDIKFDGISTNSLAKKTNRICRNIESLFFNSENINKSGSFLIVKYKEAEKGEYYNANDNMFLAYKEGYLKETIDMCLDENDNYITRFIEGIKNLSKNPSLENRKSNYNATIDVIRKVRNNDGLIEWMSEYAKPEIPIKIDFLKECNDVNFILLLRFSEKTIDDFNELIKDSQGVLVLYSNNDVFSYNRNRYLLLLRNSISNFLKKHHKSDEFRDLFEANNRSQHIRAFSHNIEMYYGMIDQIDDNSTIDPSLFKIFFTLLLNKNMILKVISDYENSKNKDLALRSNRITEKNVTIDETIKKIKIFVHEIFSFEHEIYPQINDKYYDLEFIVNGKISSITIFNHFFDEVIFEIIYNIRRTYYNYLEDYINNDKPLKIIIIISDQSIQIVNSHADYVITKEEVLMLNRRIRNRYKKKGLNLINSLSMILYNKPCQISLRNDNFCIKIPLK